MIMPTFMYLGIYFHINFLPPWSILKQIEDTIYYILFHPIITPLTLWSD